MEEEQLYRQQEAVLYDSRQKAWLLNWTIADSY